MNLDDFTEELTARAEAGTPSSGPGGQVARLTGVRHRIQVRRRRRAGVSVVAAVLLIGGLVWQPHLPFVKADQQLPAKVSLLEATFPELYGSDPRITATIGDPGERELVLRFTPPSSNLQLTSFCVPGKPVEYTGDQAPGKEAINVALTVNGHPGFVNGLCNDFAPGLGGRDTFDTDDAVRNATTWRSEFGVLPGRESVVRISYTGPDDPRVRLGVAVYELSGPRTMAGDKALEQTITFGAADRRYTLQGFDFARLKPGLAEARRSVSLPVMAEKGDVVCYGTTGAVNARDTDQLFQDGSPTGQSSAGGYGCEEVESARPAVSFRMLAAGSTRGTAVIALYRLRR